MKILYMTLAEQDVNLLPNPVKADYMSDLLFHGLRSVYGADVVDFPKKSHLYRGYDNKEGLWGRGFTYTDILDDIPVDREIDNSKILSNHYDLIVLSVHHSIHSSPHNLYSMLESLNGFTKAKIAVVDGHDLTDTYDFVLDYTPYLFKREIAEYPSKYLPISFAIPKDKIVVDIPKKTKLLAGILPADANSPNRSTHSFTREEDYYKDYQDSYFALTCKKGGWDCLRHYEIMANGCVPIFTDIENCPRLTLTTLPKQCLLSVKSLPFLNLPSRAFTKDEIDPNRDYVNVELFQDEITSQIIDIILQYTIGILTTEQLAKDFVRRIYENS